MHTLSPPTAKSLSNVFHIPIASPTNAATSTNVSTPKSTHRPHGFKKIQLISPSTPTSPPNTGKLGKLLKPEIMSPKREPAFQTSSPKISIFDLPKKNSLAFPPKSLLDPSLDNLDTKRARKFTIDTERNNKKLFGSQGSIQEIIGIEGNPNTARPKKPLNKGTPKNKSIGSTSQRILTEGEKPKPKPQNAQAIKPMTARESLPTNASKMQPLKPKEVAKHFDFSRPKEKIPINYHLKGLHGSPNIMGLKSLAHAPVSARPHEAHKDVVNGVQQGGANVNVSTTLITEMNASGNNSLFNGTLKPLSISHGIDKVEESVSLNMPTATQAENDASRSNIKKPSNILSKELEIKYGIKLDYSSNSITSSEDDNEESEEIKDDINQLGASQGPHDKKMHRMLKEGSFAKNRGGYLVKSNDRSLSVEDTNEEAVQESQIKKKVEDVFSSQSKEFFHFNESHLKFSEFTTSLFKNKGVKPGQKNTQKKPWRATSKQTQEEYKPMVARSHGGNFVQPKFMKHMGSMCYTELWPKHFSLRVEKFILKEEEHEKSHDIAKNTGKKGAVKKEEIKKEEVQKSFQRKFRGTLQSWGNNPMPIPTETSEVLTTKRKSDGSITSMAK